MKKDDFQELKTPGHELRGKIADDAVSAVKMSDKLRRPMDYTTSKVPNRNRFRSRYKVFHHLIN
jgi:hypothetical protein